MTTYRILCNGEVIGTSNLEVRDPGMGTAIGEFTPTREFARVRHVFQLFARAHDDRGATDRPLVEEYYRARDALNLTVEAGAGKVIPTAVVHIVDFRDDLPDSACQVEIHPSDPAFFTERSEGNS